MRIPTTTVSPIMLNKTTNVPARTLHASAWGLLPVLGLMAGPVAAETSNAVVIDFDQGRLILGWIGLWLVAALTFAVCADKRIRLMTRLADYLDRRAQRRTSARVHAALRDMAQGDPRLLAELIAAVETASLRAPVDATPRVAPAAPVMEVVAALPSLPAPRAAKTASHAPRSRGFRTAPLPGLPQHMQYLPG